MTQAISIITISRPLGRPRKHAAAIEAAGREANRQLAELSASLAPGVKLRITDPVFTKGSVTITIIRTTVDELGNPAFEPYETTIVLGGRSERCLVKGPPNSQGQIPVLLTSGGTSQAALADASDLADPPELQPQRVDQPG